MLSDDLRKFLLDGTDPSVKVRVLEDLLDRPGSDPEVAAARTEVGQTGWAAKILADQQARGHWEQYRGDGNDLYLPKYVASNWRLIVLSDLGVAREDPRVARGAELLLDAWSTPDGGSFGGPESEVCVTGNAVRMLTRFGYGDDPRVLRAVDWLVAAQKEDGGWHCFPEFSSGTLDAWEAMAAFAALPPVARSPPVRRAIERGAEFFLERGLLRDADGTGYAPWGRIHYPTHYYYDFLVGLDVMSALGYGGDPRMGPALDLLERKRGPGGTWSLDLVHPDLGPTEEYRPATPVYPFLVEHVGLPSRWATLVALRVLKRAGRG